MGRRSVAGWRLVWRVDDGRSKNLLSIFTDRAVSLVCFRSAISHLVYFRCSWLFQRSGMAIVIVSCSQEFLAMAVRVAIEGRLSRFVYVSQKSDGVIASNKRERLS